MFYFAVCVHCTSCFGVINDSTLVTHFLDTSQV